MAHGFNGVASSVMADLVVQHGVPISVWSNFRVFWTVQVSCGSKVNYMSLTLRGQGAGSVSTLESSPGISTTVC